MNFEKLGLTPALQGAVVDMGLAIPTPIQIEAIAPALQGRDVWAAMPHARYVTAPGVGHLINLEAPEFFNAQVQRFIGEHPIR